MRTIRVVGLVRLSRVQKSEHSRPNYDDLTHLNARETSPEPSIRRAEIKILALDRVRKRKVVALVRLSECRTANIRDRIMMI